MRTMPAPQKIMPTDLPAFPALVPGSLPRSSFQTIVSSEHRPLPTRQVTAQRSSVKDYRRLNTVEERIRACLRTYTAEVLSVYGNKESMLKFSEQTVFDFMETQKCNGLSQSEVHLVLIRIAYLDVVEKAEHDPYRILSLFFKTIMGY
jgi:hypothetical protein